MVVANLSSGWQYDNDPGKRTDNSAAEEIIGTPRETSLHALSPGGLKLVDFCGP